MTGDEDEDLVLESLESLDDDGDSDEGEVERSAGLLANTFGVAEVDGRIIMRRRPGARLDLDDAVNLAVWIIAASGAELHDVEDLVRVAVEGG